MKRLEQTRGVSSADLFVALLAFPVPAGLLLIVILVMNDGVMIHTVLQHHLAFSACTFLITGERFFLYPVDAQHRFLFVDIRFDSYCGLDIRGKTQGGVIGISCRESEPKI